MYGNNSEQQIVSKILDTRDILAHFTLPINLRLCIWLELVQTKEINGVPMFRFCKKLKLPNVELKKLNQEFFGGLPLKVQKARDDTKNTFPSQRALLQKENVMQNKQDTPSQSNESTKYHGTRSRVLVELIGVTVPNCVKFRGLKRNNLVIGI